jgi:hypothetical protein
MAVSKSSSMLDDQEVRHVINSYRESNRLSLEIVNFLRQQFNYLAEHHGPIGNIVGLVFHDLIVHFSGIVIQREFVKSHNSEYETES